VRSCLFFCSMIIFLLYVDVYLLFLYVDQRGVKCVGCSEKPDFVKKCEETDHMEL
jgi:hypothetical protein